LIKKAVLNFPNWRAWEKALLTVALSAYPNTDFPSSTLSQAAY
jgi:hypothetical protein